ncbi:MAG: sensor histidine kinase [Actinobacteria bacterium]|nr:sensor histidine kinase [Actinomycetota bacterium]
MTPHLASTRAKLRDPLAKRLGGAAATVTDDPEILDGSDLPSADGRQGGDGEQRAAGGRSIARSTLLAQTMAANALAIAALVFFAVLVLDVRSGFGTRRAELVLLLVAIAGALLLNMVILRRQFAPLELLVETMEKIDLTSPGERAEMPRGATDDVADLIGAFNEMIDRLEQERRDKTAAAVEAQENERARVARDLHDEANQALTAVILRLEAASQSAPPELAAEINEAKALAGQAMEELLEVVRRLRPTILDLGLRNALSSLVNDFGDRTGLDASFEFVGDPRRRLGNERELTIYRVVQEALSNIVQHADATRVNVRLSVGDSVDLEVEDNGRGFKPGSPTRRFGITGMKERAQLVNGEIVIESTPGQGTTLRMELP